MSDPFPASECSKRNVKQVLILENSEKKHASLITSGHPSWKLQGNNVLITTYKFISRWQILENIFAR